MNVSVVNPKAVESGWKNVGAENEAVGLFMSEWKLVYIPNINLNDNVILYEGNKKCMIALENKLILEAIEKMKT
ncbi:MAG: hypothetical protein FWH22_09165, partial [Fibromonadales bacterium]|nr:hypothetical protein [Fibromonadales bacterium]